MQMESWVPPCVLFGWYFSPWELFVVGWVGLVSWYCCSSYGVKNLFSYFSYFLNTSIGDPWLSSMVGCKHPPMHMSGSGRACQETAISGSCQHALVGIHKSVCVWWLYMEWIPMLGSPWMVFPSVSAPYFISVFAPMGILFPFLRRTEAPTLWFSFFLSFM